MEAIDLLGSDNLSFCEGATLMAAGTSSPELFTSLVAIAGPVADIGTGTIVGSGATFPLSSLSGPHLWIGSNL